MSLRLMLMVAALLAPAVASADVSEVTPVPPGSPFDRVYNPQNLPSAAEAAASPQGWPTIYADASRDGGVFAFKDGSRTGVSWRFAQARAWPLDRPPYNKRADGMKSAETTAAQWMGDAVGVSIAKGMVFSASSDQFIYALNARTGKLTWRVSPVGSTFMGQPLVDGDRVFVNAGSVGFNYSNLQRFGRTGKAVRGAGVAYNGIYALDRTTGRLLWRYDTAADTMPTPALSGGRLIFSDGAGEIISLDEATGKKVWQSNVGGMGNMSSPAVVGGRVFVGMASPAFLYSLDAASGKVVWKATIAHAVNTGMGDVSPAVADGVVVTDAVSNVQDPTPPQGQVAGAGKTNGASRKTLVQPVAQMTMTIAAYDTRTGKSLWSYTTARGPKPPSFKGGVPMIHDGVVYVGEPVTDSFQALDLKSGRLLWTWKVSDPSEAGSGRGPAAYADGRLYVSTGPSLYALDPKTGHLLGERKIGGRFGIGGPTILGGTAYLGNVWDWVFAEPLSAVARSRS